MIKRAWLLISIIIFVIAFGTATAQNYPVPKQHSKLHADHQSVQNNYNTELENQDIRDYFYPLEDYTYRVTPNSEISHLMINYRLLQDKVLCKTVAGVIGHSLVKMSEEAYLLTYNGQRQAIESSQQIIQSDSGTRSESYKTTLFLLPTDDKVVSWKETKNDETLNCSARFVYITFTIEGEKQYHKAVKIEKETPINKSSSVKDWSYWVKGLGCLATYGYWGDPKKVSCIEKCVNIGLEGSINEISKTEFDKKE